MTDLNRVIEQLQTLIATPSISSTNPSIDSGNVGVINHLASWASDLGFRCEIMTIAPGKANLIATLGEGPGGLVLAGHTDTVPCDDSGWHSDPFAGAIRDDALRRGTVPRQPGCAESAGIRSCEDLELACLLGATLVTAVALALVWPLGNLWVVLPVLVTVCIVYAVRAPRAWHYLQLLHGR